MEHLSEDNIKYSEFFVTHREFFKRLALFVFFFIDVVIVLNLAFRFLVYNQGIVAQIETENSLAVSYIPFDQLREQFASKPIQVNSVTVIPIGFQQYDIVAKVHNPNDKWLAKKINIDIVFDGKKLDQQSSFVLPSTDQYISVFGLRSSSVSPQATIQITDTQWTRIRDAEPLDIVSRFSFTQPTFRNEPGEGFQVDASLTNDSLFSFWDFGIHVLAFRQGQTIGVNYTTLERVKTGSTREFTVVWPQNLISPDQVRFIPDINVFDETNFMPFSEFNASPDPSGID